VGSGRRPRRPRIATWSEHDLAGRLIGGSGRRPRRPRIATPDTAHVVADVEQAAAAVRGGRGSQQPTDRGDVGAELQAAAAVRGGRGSQLTGMFLIGIAALQRPPSAAAEDRNMVDLAAAITAPIRQRPPSAAAEDRNSASSS